MIPANSVSGELLTRWTVRVALALYVAALALRMMGGSGRVARLAWSTGCMFFVVHVACAFQFYHHWSHDAAFAETARQTLEVTGLNWGSGIFANYAFTVLWLADAACWWADARSYLTRSRWIEWAVQGFMAFIAFNATVVFGAGAIRWFGLAGCALLAAFFWLGRDRAKSPGLHEPTPPQSRADESPRQ